MQHTGVLRSSGRRRERGTSLLEVAIATVIVLSLLGAVLLVMRNSLSARDIVATADDLQRRSGTCIDAVASELVLSGSSVMSPIPDSSTSTLTAITYQKNTGYTGGYAQWGAPVKLEMQDDPTDPDDGSDNNGNGLVDEKVLVLITDYGGADERSTILTRFVRALLEGEEANGVDDNGNGLVDEPGFCITLHTNVWTVRLTLERPTASGALLSRTVETSITPRN